MPQRSLPSGVGLTALSVARERQSESQRPDRLFRDDLAEAFCNAARQLVGPDVFLGLDVAIGDVVPFLSNYMGVRTRYFDDEILAAVDVDCRQAVFLASGFDVRAFRLEWPAGMRLFELDQPDVVAFKQSVLDEVGAIPKCERHGVAVDFSGDWPAALLQAGFSPREPTVWVMEGLLIYFTREENDRLMETVGGLSAPGSHLVIEHADTQVLKNPAIQARMGDALEREGITFKSCVADPIAWMARHGWTALLLDVDTYVRALGRPVPPLLDGSRGAGRLWLANGAR